MFEGFYEETTRFLWELRLNNERPWFQAHKQDYLDYLYNPLKERGEEVQARMLEKYPRSRLNLRVVRIYRDARRIHYGGPYKEHLWFSLSPAIENRRAVPMFYFEVMPEGYEYGMGYCCPKPSLMEAYRQQILATPKEMERLARKLNRQTRFVLEGEEYKRPKGEVSDLLKPWFNRKTLFLSSFSQPDDCFLTPELVDRVVDGFDWLMPYYRYLKKIPAVE